ncbi:PhoX family phosphatase [Idiomarina sp. M1R2S28]|uniref:PhoX family phosphatase n=1 Tax=Idiomarina rhizosphaerae TaxID=2961572 RepID=A0A9X2JS20_9GAMM|nr:PhoX family phosphatase [Idiomarina rhizosphaerae]MCP1338280.1 PhoX family phosphatase [Idiomarina rhizosphaerae]
MTTKEKKLKIDISGVDPICNKSKGDDFYDVVNRQLSRRSFLKGGLGVAVSSFMLSPLMAGCTSSKGSASSSAGLGFQAVAGNRTDVVDVPVGYRAQPFLPWGTPLVPGAGEFKTDASNSALDQARQVGSHHDGMHFFPIDVKEGGASSKEGLLVMNHEYVDPQILHASFSPNAPRPQQEVLKEMMAHGVSVAHIIRKPDGEWQLIEGSPYNRRITASTPMQMSGPVAGHDKLITRFSPEGTKTRGTINNCSHGHTPWGTYLTCEENWAGCFMNDDETHPREHERYGVNRENSRYYWETATPGLDETERFNASSTGASAAEDYRNEPNHFGWIVEIDPFNAKSTPVKRSMLGRFAHEGIVFAPAVEGEPLVAYSGDDSRFEYIYKFVSAKPYYKATASGDLLNEGTLYVAHFNDDGTGRWLPLDIENSEFQAKVREAGVEFHSQADVLLNTRLAADVMGATKMDRPEWGAVHPTTKEVYFSLTNNTRRTEVQTNAMNPRAENAYGHIVRWSEDKQQSAESFHWDIFLMGGEAGTHTPNAEGNDVTLTSDNQFACPDGLWFDYRGTLWIQTDMSGELLSQGSFGNNGMYAANPESGELKRFLVGPVDCEITGVVTTPDGKTMFVNVQHPGDRLAPGKFSSSWPAGNGARPRSATVIITREDGGVVGA